MIEKDDWRLINQDKYLKGVKVKFQKYFRCRETWDHDHCEFCWKEFSISNNPNVETEGYTTEDNYHWICKECFEDFKEMFEWELI